MAATAASNGKPFSHLERLKSTFCLCVDSGVVVRAELTLLSQHMGDFSPLSTHLYQRAGISSEGPSAPWGVQSQPRRG